MPNYSSRTLAAPLKPALIWPLASIMLALVAVLLITAATFVRQMDHQSLQREQHIVQNGIEQFEQEIALRVVPQIVWDDAVRHLDNDFDRAWAEENIGGYLHQTLGFDATFVLDAHDRPIFASVEGETVEASAYSAYGAVLTPALQRLRAREAGRSPLATAIHSDLIAPPIQELAIAWVGDDLKLLSATLVQPDFGHASITGAAAPVVVAATSLDEELLGAFASRFLLDEVHVHAADSRNELGEAHVALRDADGVVIASLDWLPRRPGTATAQRARGPVLGVVGLLLVSAAIFFWRSQKMTERFASSEARARRLAYFDSLTGLPNRVRLLELIAEQLDDMRRGGASFALVALDLDRFKQANDSWGHLAGDQLICEAARRFGALHDGATTLARLASDEFALLLPGVTQAEATRVAQAFVDAMKPSAEVAGSHISVGCSAGVALVEEPVSPEDAMRMADIALNEAKRLGGGRHALYEASLDLAVRNKQRLEEELTSAVRSGALSVAYQPQVSKSGVLAGVEALVRWKHPTHGMVSPGIFVPLAEDCGLMGELGMFVMERAFDDARTWRHLKVAINVSASQLRDPTFAAAVGALARCKHVRPNNFELEITEGVFLGDDAVSRANLDALREMGFTIALDDFGTGYSTLSYLKRLPISKIKIDRSFVTNVGVDAQADAVVAAIVRLARAMGLAIIAEGVESKAQHDRLVELGCGDAQGYLFGKAVSATQIARLLGAEQKARAAA